jgi:hypothetical protein
MELMQLNAAQMATYGIVISIPQLTLTLLANIETATKSDCGREFCSAMHAICKKYIYNHVHNATLLQFIPKELACANGERVLKDTSAPGTRTVHLVAASVSYLQAMMGEDREDVVAELILTVNPLYPIMSVPMLNYNWCLALRSVLSTSWVWPK